MRKILSKHFLFIMSVSLVFAMLLSNSASAASLDSDYEAKVDAINKSGFYNPETNKMVVSRELAKSFYNFSESELDAIQTNADNLTQEQIEYILAISGVDLDNLDININSAHANWLWLIPVILGIIVVGGLIFMGLYFNHSEKIYFGTMCMQQYNGSVKLDSRDSAGWSGTTSSAKAEAANGYSLECIKK